MATDKHIHVSFDTVEKDTWRHLVAGVAITVASTPTKVVTIRSKTLLLEEAIVRNRIRESACFRCGAEIDGVSEIDLKMRIMC